MGFLQKNGLIYAFSRCSEWLLSSELLMNLTATSDFRSATSSCWLPPKFQKFFFGCGQPRYSEIMIHCNEWLMFFLPVSSCSSETGPRCSELLCLCHSLLNAAFFWIGSIILAATNGNLTVASIFCLFYLVGSRYSKIPLDVATGSCPQLLHFAFVSKNNQHILRLTKTNLKHAN